MIKIGVVGFSGRVNSLIIEEILSSKESELSGVLVRSIPEEDDFPFALYDDVEEFINNVDAIIDFTNPSTSLMLAEKLQNTKVLLVSGTTGFSPEEFEKFKSYAKYSPIIWSANMSIGINLLLKFIEISSSMLGDEFDTGVSEVHHRHKKDSPSGTALMLANAIAEAGAVNKVQIESMRLAECKGEHMVIFSSAEESLAISHNVFTRNIYAKGAIKACKWGVNKEPGFYSMMDVLQ